MSLLNNIIKFTFAVVGAVTGFTLTKSFLLIQNPGISRDFTIIIFIAVSTCTALIFYSTSNKFIELVLDLLDKLERNVQSMTLYELTVSSVGLIVGLIVANLITLPVNKLDVIGVPLSIIANILFGCIGAAIAIGKRNESLLDSFKNSKKGTVQAQNSLDSKLLDTSVIIDGRIVDICRSGFMQGEFIIPGFILEELRHIADSSDALKRNKGRRGFDILNILRNDLKYPIRVENIDIPDVPEVDDKLLLAAKKLGSKIITVDYNLNKMASLQGIIVLNINELANAVKPIALPGEEMNIQVIKDGKENGQGIAYLDDGTMIVVEGGRKHIGETVIVVVTSILQTAAGRMIFAKPKYNIERVI